MNGLFIQRLGEKISELFSCGNIEKFHFALLRDIPDKVVPDLDVLGLRVLNWVLSYENSTCVVTADRSLSEFVAIVEELILNPQHLSTASTSSYILSFSGGTGH